MSRVSVSLQGGKEVAELLDSLSGRELQNRTRRGTRAGAKVFREAVRSEARSRADIPKSFAKTATRSHRRSLGTSTGPRSPLLNIFENGARRHAIGRSGQILSNLSARRDAADQANGGPFFARGPVSHPGMSARPLIRPVFERELGHAANEAMDAILEGLR